jgi:hypothetical protein
MAAFGVLPSSCPSYSRSILSSAAHPLIEQQGANNDDNSTGGKLAALTTGQLYLAAA